MGQLRYPSDRWGQLKGPVYVFRKKYMNTFMEYNETVNTIKYMEYNEINWNTIKKRQWIQWKKRQWIQWNIARYIEIY